MATIRMLLVCTRLVWRTWTELKFGFHLNLVDQIFSMAISWLRLSWRWNPLAKRTRRSPWQTVFSEEPRASREKVSCTTFFLWTPGCKKKIEQIKLYKFVVWMNIIITMHGFAHGQTTDLICLSLRWCSLWPPGVDLERWSWATHSWMDRGQGRDFDQRTLGSVWVLWDPPRWLSKFLETSSSQFQTIASGRKQVYNFQSYWDSQIISF